MRVHPVPNARLFRSFLFNPFPAVIGCTSIFTATMIEQHHLAPGLARLLALAAGAGMGELILVFILLQRYFLRRK